MEIKEIKTYYKTISTQELLSLANEASKLRIEVVPILQEELICREQHEAAERLSEFLTVRPTEMMDMSHADIEGYISKRLDEGDSFNLINADLKAAGLNVYEQLNREGDLQDSAIEYLAILKSAGLEENAILDAMAEHFDTPLANVDVLKRRAKTQGRYMLIVGCTLSVIILFLIFLSVVEGGNMVWRLLIALCGTIGLIFKGYSLRSKV